MVDPTWVRICDLARLVASSAKSVSLMLDKDASVFWMLEIDIRMSQLQATTTLIG